MSEFRWNFNATNFDSDTFTATLDVQRVFRETYRKMLDAEARVEDEAVAQYLRDKGWTVTK